MKVPLIETAGSEQRLVELLSDPRWRIDNLYYIIDKTGTKRRFKMNWAQETLYKEMWYLNIILKARQLGLSTFVGLLFLDRCFFNNDVSAGIIAHTREDAEKLFRRIKYAYDCLPKELKDFRHATIDSARELRLSNGSILSVGTSMRGSTLQYLHVSEFGKICASYPQKAEEIITGSLNTIATGQYVFIESTAEGSGGAFHDIYKKAEKGVAEKLRLTPLDFKPFFFPWWKEPDYKLAEYVEPKGEMKEYFQKLEVSGVNLGGAQQAWYLKKHEVLGDAIYQEFPSTPDEAFKGSASGLFYGKHLLDMHLGKRSGNVPYDEGALVHTAWDLGGAGGGDRTAIWFFQTVGNEVHLIDFYQDNGKSLAEYIRFIKSKPYPYGMHLVPHDIAVHEYSFGFSRVEIARQLGLDLTPVRRKDEHKLSVIEGIDAVRALFPRLWVDKEKCGEGIRMLENYRKEWDERLVRWSDKPIHDYASDAADALRSLAVGLSKVTESSGSIKDDYAALNRYWRG